jgi:hypothetical protein
MVILLAVIEARQTAGGFCGSGSFDTQYGCMRDVLALSFGTILSILLAVAPLATIAVKASTESAAAATDGPLPQCFPYDFVGIVTRHSLLNHWGNSLLALSPIM